MTVSCFLQIVFDSVLLSAVCVCDSVLFLFKLFVTVSCFIQLLCDSVLLSSVCL